MPEESIVFHAARNHFSRWLKARTEFALAHELRPRRPADYPDAEALRADLIRAIAAYRDERAQVVVADFDRATFDFVDATSTGSAAARSAARRAASPSCAG